MIEKILISLGLKHDEIRVYMALLEQDRPVTVGVLSKKLSMARASLYGFLERLQEKGLARQSTESTTKTFFPESPEKIDMILKKQIEMLETERKDFQALLPVLEKKPGASMLSPRFSFFEGVSGVQHILNDMLLYRDIETSSLWPIQEMMDILSPDFFRYHNAQRIQNNISVRAIWPRNRVVDVRKLRLYHRK